MEKVRCFNCSREFRKSPSKIKPRNFCSRDCYAKIRNEELQQRGVPYRIDSARSKELKRVSIPALRTKTTGANHYSWKGEGVGYRGLHYWLRRTLGVPDKCSKCDKADTRPRFIQWASVNGKYPRDPRNYVPLCGSCHKLHDLELARKSTQDVLLAIE